MLKRHRVLSFAYILFLIASIVLDAYLKENRTTSIALGATIAGYFFALADNFSSNAEHMMFHVEDMKRWLNSRKDYYEALRVVAKKELEGYRKSLDAVANYKGVYNVADNVASVCESGTSHWSEIDSDSENALNEIKSSLEKVAPLLRRGNRNYIISNVLMMLGFFSFFVVFGFTAVTNWLMPSQNALTILAFAMILVNYEAKDYFGRKNKAETQKTDEYMKNRAKQTGELSEIHFSEDLYNISLQIDEIAKQEMRSDTDGQTQEVAM